ncbi:hypothetical protein QTP88_019392 [Uroleucon formosanum]
MIRPTLSKKNNKTMLPEALELLENCKEPSDNSDNDQQANNPYCENAIVLNAGETAMDVEEMYLTL